MDGSDFWDVVELLDWGRGAMTSSQLSPSWHIWPLFLPGSYSPSTTRWRPICARSTGATWPIGSSALFATASSLTSFWAGGARASRAEGAATRTPSRGALPRPLRRVSRNSCSPPRRAWARGHGTNPEAYPHRPVPSCQAFGNRDGWAW